MMCFFFFGIKGIGKVGRDEEGERIDNIICHCQEDLSLLCRIWIRPQTAFSPSHSNRRWLILLLSTSHSTLSERSDLFNHCCFVSRRLHFKRNYIRFQCSGGKEPCEETVGVIKTLWIMNYEQIYHSTCCAKKCLVTEKHCWCLEAISSETSFYFTTTFDWLVVEVAKHSKFLFDLFSPQITILDSKCFDIHCSLLTHPLR